MYLPKSILLQFNAILFFVVEIRNKTDRWENKILSEFFLHSPKKNSKLQQQQKELLFI